MNIQDILRKGGTKLSAKLDVSELYDYELIDVIIGKVDAVLDYSEFYDYTLGDNTKDYIYIEIFVTTITGKVLITDDNFIITTDDNYMIEYV